MKYRHAGNSEAVQTATAKNLKKLQESVAMAKKNLEKLSRKIQAAAAAAANTSDSLETATNEEDDMTSNVGTMDNDGQCIFNITLTAIPDS